MTAKSFLQDPSSKYSTKASAFLLNILISWNSKEIKYLYSVSTFIASQCVFFLLFTWKDSWYHLQILCSWFFEGQNNEVEQTISIAPLLLRKTSKIFTLDPNNWNQPIKLNWIKLLKSILPIHTVPDSLLLKAERDEN